MMKKNRLIPSLSLLVLLFAACAPAAVTEAPVPSAAPAVVIAPSATPFVEVATPTLAVAPTEALAPTALPVATSRGPNLEATDPSTVSLASGNIQFVEFFRFT